MSQEKLRLLVLSSTYPRWPADSEPAFVHDLCRELTDTFDVTVLAPHTRGARLAEVMDGVTVRRFRYLPEAWASLAYEGGIPAKIRANPIRLVQVPFLLVAQFVATWRLVREWNPHVVHAHWIVPQGFTAMLVRLVLRRRFSLVCTAHGADLYWMDSAVMRALKSRVLRSADAVTVVGRAMLEEALKLGAPAGATWIAPMGIDIDGRFRMPQRTLGDSPTILFVGRLVEKKGVNYLLEALPLVLARYPDARLVIVGDGPERPALEARAAELGIGDRVTFIGAVEQARLPGFYAAASVAAFPFVVGSGGDREGLGLVVREALACGCPVVASDLPAVHDSVQDGRSGLLAKPGDPADLAGKIMSVLGNPQLAQQLSENGRRIADTFSWRHSAGTYRRILKSIIGLPAIPRNKGN